MFNVSKETYWGFINNKYQNDPNNYEGIFYKKYIISKICFEYAFVMHYLI